MCDLRELFNKHRFRFKCERDLHIGIASMLDGAGIAFEQERVLGPRDRIDFYLPQSKIGIEVKIKGSPGWVLEQLKRYAQSPDIKYLYLVTARLQLKDHYVCNKPVEVITLVPSL